MDIYEGVKYAPVVGLVSENELRGVEGLNEIEVRELINDELLVAGLAIFERERHLVNVIGRVQGFERQIEFDACACAECGQHDLTVQQLHRHCAGDISDSSTISELYACVVPSLCMSPVVTLAFN